MDINKQNDGTVGEEGAALAQRIKGAANDLAGRITNDPDLEGEGKHEKAVGRARQESNNVVGKTDVARSSNVGEGQSRYVTALYPTPEAATRAYTGLTTDHGYKSDDIDVMMSEDTRKRYFGDAEPGTELSGGTKAAEGMGKGGMIGGGIGAALGALFAIGTSIVIPGLGLVVAGPLAAALTGFGAGGVTGGLIGALVGAGIPEDRAREYERGLNEGGILIGTRPRDDKHAADLERDFGTYGGRDVR